MRISFHSISTRVLFVPIVAVVSLAAVGLMSIFAIRNVTLTEHEARARVATEAAVKIVQSFEARAAKGEMSEQTAQEEAKSVLRAIRYDGSEYIIVRGLDGVILVNGAFPAREGSKSLDDKDSNGTDFARDMIARAKSGGGFNYYLWPKKPNTPPVRKATYSKLSGSWQWVVGSGVYLDNVDAASWSNTIRTGTIVAILALVSFGLAVWLGRLITRPILSLTAVTHCLADGDLSVGVPEVDRRDEIGTLAQAVSVLKEKSAEAARLRGEQESLKAEQEAMRGQAEIERRASMNRMADRFDADVKGIVDVVSHASGELQSTAQSMSATAEETERQSAAVAAAAEQASTNVQTVTSAAEELSASIGEITHQVAESARIAAQAVNDAERTNGQVQALADAAQQIGDVVKLINDIAGQTNLLALNATIEAARAGEAGKGFAVVASEVKSLATQTAKATEEIAGQIKGIQGATTDAVSAIQGIGRTIGQINEIATAIASAVEEQGAATKEIARNVQQAWAGTNEVSSNISGVTKAASETGAASTQVLSAAGELSKNAETLRSQVDQFLLRIRAA